MPVWRSKPSPRNLSGGIVGAVRESLLDGAVIIPMWEGSGLKIATSRQDIFGDLQAGAGTQINWSRQPWGHVLQWAGAPSNTRVDLTRPLIGPSKQFSIGVIYNTTNVPTGTLYSEGDSAAGGNNPAIMMGVNAAVAGDIRMFIRDDAGVTGSAVSGAVSSNDGLWHAAVGRSRGASLRDVWLDGVQVGTNSTTLGAWTPDNAKIGAWLLAGTPGEQYGGLIAMVVVWPKRSLSDREIRRFSSNPFGILQPQRRRGLLVPKPVYQTFVDGNRVRETTAVVGTGAATLLGAPSGLYIPFSSVCAHADRIAYTIAGGSQWEAGVGTWLNDNTLVRTDIEASSSGGARVDFVAGTKDIFCTQLASQGITALSSRVQVTDRLVPPGTTLLMQGRYQIAKGKRLRISRGATLSIG